MMIAPDAKFAQRGKPQLSRTNALSLLLPREGRALARPNLTWFTSPQVSASQQQQAQLLFPSGKFCQGLKLRPGQKPT